MRRPQRGFTLVELMVVVAIIAILGALIVGISGRTYGVNATTMSDQLVQSFNFARQRALSTRKIHRVSIRLDLAQREIHVWQAFDSGMNRANLTTALIDPSCTAKCARLVERTIIPNSVSLRTAVTGIAAATGANPAATTAQFDIDFLPNGSADVANVGSGTDAATIYVTDASNVRQTRVLVYSTTGSSYARKNW